MTEVIYRRPIDCREPAKGLRIALTGGIGSGKSTVTALLATYPQVETISADDIAHELYEVGSPVVQQVIDAFGEAVSDHQGGIDRATLGALVFSDPEKREKLQAITHPVIRHRATDFLNSGTRRHVRLYDIPLFVESGGITPVDCVISVETPPETAVQRLRTNRNMTPEQSWKRIHTQATNKQRRHVADIVIVNDGTLDDLRAAIADNVWPHLHHLLR